MLDSGGHIASWNRGAQIIKGYVANEIIGKYIDVFYTKADQEKNEPHLNLQAAVRDGHFETEGLRVRKDGSTFYANAITPLIDEMGGLYG